MTANDTVDVLPINRTSKSLHYPARLAFAEGPLSRPSAFLSSRLRLRCRAFCLRSRLNLDLSPLSCDKRTLPSTLLRASSVASDAARTADPSLRSGFRPSTSLRAGYAAQTPRKPLTSFPVIPAAESIPDGYFPGCGPTRTCLPARLPDVQRGPDPGTRIDAQWRTAPTLVAHNRSHDYHVGNAFRVLAQPLGSPMRARL